VTDGAIPYAAMTEYVADAVEEDEPVVVLPQPLAE
jgi:hypothetical protein